jgi:signal transduction histidine kinase
LIIRFQVFKMPTPAFSKDLTSIFNSHDLREDLKYDLTCRLIGESLQVATVSLLLYEAHSDTLTCKGSYLAPSRRSHYIAKEDKILGELIENMAVFEYFDAGPVNWWEMNFDNFKSSVVHGETSQNLAINQATFTALKESWIRGEYQKKYREYKLAIHEETHTLDSSTISSRFFLKMLMMGKKFAPDVECSLMRNGPRKGQLFYNTWTNLDINIPGEGLYYIGLPLFASERYTGILRLSTTRDPQSAIDDLLDLNQPEKRAFQLERLNNFAQLVSLHLKTNYLLDGYRALGQLKLGALSNKKKDSRELDELCSALTQAIHCRGCILRLNISQADRNDPPIRGISESLFEYREYSQRQHGSPFSQDITELLKAKTSTSKDIKAINFSIPPDHGSDTFVTLEYYYEDDILKAEKNEGRQLKDFTPDYIKILQNLLMTEVVVVRLEFNEHGFLIFTNTDHKKFTSSDIEMILLASKRIGQEIKHHSDSDRIQEQNKIIAQEEHARLIVHQIGAPVRALSGHAQNLDDGIFKDHQMPLKITQLNKMSVALMRQVSSLQKYLDWEVKPITPRRDTRFSLENHIRRMAIQFEGLMVGRNQRIWTIIENQPDFFDECNIDRPMLDEIVNCLLDNAVKYSYSASELISKKVDFIATDRFSPGHIHILLDSTPQRLVLTVRNWGCPIDFTEYDRIFDRGIRGRFGKKKSPIGSGIGLYLAKKVVEAFQGRIDVTHEKSLCLTNFKITIPYG